MSPLWPRRLVLTLAVLLWPRPLDAGLPKLDLAPQSASLAGQLLIAAPKMPDPRFRKTVILIVRHDKQGALGVTINRPLGEVPLARLLESLGDKESTAQGSVRISWGGPVQPEMGFTVHTADYARSGTIAVNSRLAVTQSLEILRDIGEGRGPMKALIAFGYAGWAPGQLEGELAREDWFVGPANTELVFDEARERVWDEAMARRPRDL